ncbi:MAG: helix-turn-helix transcriptional regulator [Clostridia bacterium]|nr:helix-turn-helix transcriptional regulator [Clostridia bacterium]
MFWERFYSLCQGIGKKPNPVGKEIGLSSGIISKWKSGGVPNGATLMKLSKYFNVSTDYLLGISPSVEIDETDIVPMLSEQELRSQVNINLNKLNSIGLAYLAEYSEYLTSKEKYSVIDTDKQENESTIEME